jgi:hypothetical protein
MSNEFECKKCDYICNSQSLWRQHLNTRKHNKHSDEIEKNVCACGSIYKTRSGLWKHEKKCVPPKIDTNIDYKELVNQLLTDNRELRNFIIEQSKITADTMNKVIEHNTDIMNKAIDNNKPTVINQTNTQNNNNQKFNIHMYLNEECKNAMNFSDFIKSIEVSREDLENNAQLGFVSGVSKILIESLKQLGQTERPIHCTDVKRETMYIKDEDKWSKEEDNSKLNKAIQEVTRKSMGTLMNWKDENPDYKDRDSEFSGRCIVIQQNSMAAHNRDTYYPKVAKAIAKEVLVNK